MMSSFPLAHNTTAKIRLSIGPGGVVVGVWGGGSGNGFVLRLVIAQLCFRNDFFFFFLHHSEGSEDVNKSSGSNRVRE